MRTVAKAVLPIFGFGLRSAAISAKSSSTKARCRTRRRIRCNDDSHAFRLPD
jgi:hypothetical protein